MPRGSHPLQTIIIAAVAGAVGALVTAAASQLAGQPQTAAYRSPRLADGKPDLNGIWQALNEAHYDLEAHVARPALALRPGRTARSGGAGPRTGGGGRGAARPGRGGRRQHSLPAGGAGQEEREPRALARARSGNQVLSAGRAAATYMPYPFQILQSASAVFIAYEYAGAVRNVFLNDPGKAPGDSWMGQSVGRWDGDTLVVDVTGFNDSTGSIGRAIFIATRCTSSSATRGRRPTSQLRSDDRRRERVHAALEDQHAAVSSPGEGRAADGFQVRGVRGRAVVREVAEEHRSGKVESAK